MGKLIVSGPFVSEYFKINNNKKRKIYKLKPKFGFESYGEVVFNRTYSRIKRDYDNMGNEITEGNVQENWADVVIRVTEGIISIRKNHYIKNYLYWNDEEWQDYAAEFATYMFDMKFLPPGRGLWACGTKFMYERGSAALNNCGAASSKDLVLGLVWTMDMLMNGCGIGYDTLWTGEYIIPDKTKTYKYVVPDSREGWTESIGILMLAYIKRSSTKWAPDFEIPEGCEFPVFDYSKVRKMGEPIKGFGGIASGPEPLKKLHTRMEVYMDTYIGYQELTMESMQERVNKFLSEYENEDYDSDEIEDKDFGINVEEPFLCKLANLDFSDFEQTLKEHEKDWNPKQVLAKRLYDNEKLNIFIKMIDRLEEADASCGDRKMLISSFEEHLEEKTYGTTRLVVDLMNSIGACVVAGNVRRSAMLSLGEVGDEEFLNLKNYAINPERGCIGWMSNNSVRFKKSEDFAKYLPDISNRIRDNGEPGFFNELNVQRYGRVGRRQYPKELWTRENEEDKGDLANPCSEITLESYELCCLAELFPTRCVDDKLVFSEEIYHKAAKFCTFYTSTVSLLPTHWTISNAVIARNHRTGVSKSGVADFYDQYGSSMLTKICQSTYKVVRLENKRLAEEAGVCESIRVTTNKPSGTVSCITGVSPGIHFPTFKYAIRRMRVAANHKIVDVLQNANIPNEMDTYSDNTLVFEFPIDQGKTRPAKEVTIWEQFSILTTLQREWSDNMVSVTIYFNPETEGDQIEHALAQHAPLIKSCSMLPHTEAGVYAQSPYEGITEQEYARRIKEIKPIDWKNYSGNDGVMPKFCTNDTCTM